MRKGLLIGLALAGVLALTATGGTAATSQATPGVTAKNITIGSTFPLTGPASSYGVIPGAMKAYFSYVNKRKGPDGKRGVYGRQIIFKVYDDGYNPANSVQLTRRLVEQDKVFAVVGQLGTEVNVAVQPYLNQAKVPHVLVSSGASTWYRDFKEFPWTGGWQPDYEFESRLYGQAIARNSPNAKIAILYQNDDYGKDYVRGLKAGLGAKASNIVGEESFEVTATDVRSQVAKLRSTGATIFAIFATPRFTGQAYVFARLTGWNPPVIYTNSVSATDTILTAARAGGAGDLVNNTYSVQYLKDPANPKWDSDAGMKLYKQVMSTYAPSSLVTNGLNYYGVAVAHAFVQLLYKAGRNPTRDSLMKAYRTWNEANIFALPGNKQVTKGDDQVPIACDQIVKFTDGTFRSVSRLKCASPSASAAG
jgi:branched-chain amino acid transport system substrate-binding protein